MSDWPRDVVAREREYFRAEDLQAEVQRLRAELDKLNAQDEVHWKTRRSLLAEVSAAQERLRRADDLFERLYNWQQCDGAEDIAELVRQADQWRAGR